MQGARLQLYGTSFLKFARAKEEIEKVCFFVTFTYESVTQKSGDSCRFYMFPTLAPKNYRLLVSYVRVYVRDFVIF